MDRMQIAFKLGMDVLGIRVCRENYRKLCRAAYLAGEAGVHISPSRVVFDGEMYYSPRSHESGGMPSRCLFDDVEEIEGCVNSGTENTEGWKLDPVSMSRLKGLRNV